MDYFEKQLREATTAQQYELLMTCDDPSFRATFSAIAQAYMLLEQAALGYLDGESRPVRLIPMLQACAGLLVTLEQMAAHELIRTEQK